MKTTNLLILLLAFSMSIFSQKNYPLRKIENWRASTLSKTNNINYLFVVNSKSGNQNFEKINLNENKIENRISDLLHNDKIYRIITTDQTNLIYLVTVVESKKDQPKLGKLIKLKLQVGEIETIYNFNEELELPNQIDFLSGKLIFSKFRNRTPSKIFDIESKSISNLILKKNYRLFFSSRKYNSFVLVYIDRKSEDVLPIYIMDTDQNITGPIGTYSSRMVYSTNKEENKYAGIKIKDNNFNWIEKEFSFSGFPISSFMIGSKPGIIENYKKLSNYFETTSIINGNEDYLITKANDEVFVFNIKNPILTKPQTISKENLSLIENYFKKQYEYKINKIISSSLQKVFSTDFNMITEIRKLDEYSTSSSTFLISSDQNKFKVINEKEMIKDFIRDKFKIKTEQDALIFNEALNALFPPGTFEKDDIKFFKNEKNWIFVRDESFGEYKGFIVTINEEKEIVNIEYKNKIGVKEK